MDLIKEAEKRELAKKATRKESLARLKTRGMGFLKGAGKILGRAFVWLRLLQLALWIRGKLRKKPAATTTASGTAAAPTSPTSPPAPSPTHKAEEGPKKWEVWKKIPSHLHGRALMGLTGLGILFIILYFIGWWMWVKLANLVSRMGETSVTLPNQRYLWWLLAIIVTIGLLYVLKKNKSTLEVAKWVGGVAVLLFAVYLVWTNWPKWDFERPVAQAQAAPQPPTPTDPCPSTIVVTREWSAWVTLPRRQIIDWEREGDVAYELQTDRMEKEPHFIPQGPTTWIKLPRSKALRFRVAPEEEAEAVTITFKCRPATPNPV